MAINQDQAASTLKKVASDYRSKGYEIKVAPTHGDLPKFLEKFRPDLVATSKKDNVVVEIRSPENKASNDELVRLAKILESKPTWRYEVIIATKTDEHRLDEFRSKPLLTERQICERLDAARKHLSSNLADTAILISWSTGEAVLRRIALRNNVSLEELSGAYLIKALYTYGHLNWRQLRMLQRVSKLRNQIAHGFQIKSDKQSVGRFIDLIQKLCDKLHDDSAKSFKEPVN